MKKVCIVTTARSEYGLLRWTIDAVHNDPDLDLQLVVSGTHLLEEYGLTYKEIESDGYPIAYKADMQLKSDYKFEIVESMGNCSIAMARAFVQLQPDLLVVLGDRYELLPICGAALVMNIPIAHIAGGEITKGAIDDKVRNALTMMSSIHFPNGKEAFDNIVRMRNSDKYVYNVGEPCIENYNRLLLKPRSVISNELGLDISKNWYIITLHSETNSTLERNLEMAHNMVNVLLETENSEIIITGSNSDYGGTQLNKFFKEIAQKHSNFHFYNSLGQVNFLSCMKESYCVMGNSSSGVIETPYLGIPTVNIGNRQTGRCISANVMCSTTDSCSIAEALKAVTSVRRYKQNYSFGDGKTSIHIINYLKHYLDERN